MIACDRSLGPHLPSCLAREDDVVAGVGGVGGQLGETYAGVVHPVLKRISNSLLLRIACNETIAKCAIRNFFKPILNGLTLIRIHGTQISLQNLSSLLSLML